MKLTFSIITALSLSSYSFGSGFHLQERSSAGLGRAFAGEAAIAEDASTMATNPANMLLLEGTQYSIGATHYRPKVEVDSNIGKVNNAAKSATVPYSFLTHRINDSWAVGIGAQSRFGLSTDYPSDFPGLIYADQSQVESYYLTPKVAYKVSDKWLIGAGLDIIYVEGMLSDTVPSTAPVNAGRHIYEVSGDDWTYGYNLGITYQATDSTRFALAYRSDVDLNLSGEADFEVTPATPAVLTADGELSTRFPGALEFSFLHKINDQWAVHGSGTWTKWSNFDELYIPTDIADIGPAPQNWKDTFRVALGTTYKHSEKWTFRAGAAFDESPVRSAEYRYFRIPDADRIWISAGATYHLNKKSSIDFGYTHVFAPTVELGADNPGVVTGDIDAEVDLFALSFNGKF